MPSIIMDWSGMSVSAASAGTMPNVEAKSRFFVVWGIFMGGSFSSRDPVGGAGFYCDVGGPWGTPETASESTLLTRSLCRCCGDAVLGRDCADDSVRLNVRTFRSYRQRCDLPM